LATFDYNAEAELFPSRGLRGRPVGYRRFARAADAIRFAIEPLLALGLKSAKSAMTPLEYAAYTSTPIIPWIVRGALEMANREQRGNREKRKPKKEKPKQPVLASSFGRLAGIGRTKTSPGSKTR